MDELTETGGYSWSFSSSTYCVSSYIVTSVLLDFSGVDTFYYLILMWLQVRKLI